MLSAHAVEQELATERRQESSQGSLNEKHAAEEGIVEPDDYELQTPDMYVVLPLQGTQPSDAHVAAQSPFLPTQMKW